MHLIGTIIREVKTWSLYVVRDWSLITGRGGYKMRKLRVQNCISLPPPPHGQGKTFCVPPFKERKLVVTPPPFNMAKTSSYCIKTTITLFVGPLPTPLTAWLKPFPPPPPLAGVKFHMPLLPFCSQFYVCFIIWTIWGVNLRIDTSGQPPYQKKGVFFCSK